MMKQPCVYILASSKSGTLIIGVTNHLIQHVWQHKNCKFSGFTNKYNVDLLVNFEMHSEMYTVITRKRQLKKWRRQWKVELIEQENPEWIDLYPSLF